MAKELLAIDRAECIWACNGCRKEIEFSDDPVEVLTHQAACVELDPTRRERRMKALVSTLKMQPIDRALLAHVLKHPEDLNARFSPSN